MRQLVVLSAVVIILAGLSGCQQSSVNGSKGKKIPAFLAGKWASDVGYWGIEISRDGSIPFVSHPLCAVTLSVKEGGYSVEGPNDTYAYFILGQCSTDYDSDTRNLKVKIILDSFEFKLPTGSLAGRSEDYFQGPVSEDGKTWHADWRGYGYIDGKADPNRKEIDENPEKLVFTKIAADK
jgi:hypothetical protein